MCAFAEEQDADTGAKIKFYTEADSDAGNNADSDVGADTDADAGCDAGGDADANDRVC